jgi:hypothetical protein
MKKAAKANGLNTKRMLLPWFGLPLCRVAQVSLVFCLIFASLGIKTEAEN